MHVLRALAQRSSPATAAQLSRVAGKGTPTGIRRALVRLAGHGLVSSEQVADRTVYTLNRDHVLYPAVSDLLRVSDELSRRLRSEISDWQVPPASAALYGSAARRDGDTSSDIDLLIIRPANLTSRQRALWAAQVDRIRNLTQRWTGNRCQITDRSVSSLKALTRSREPITDNWRKEAIVLAGARIDQLLGEM